jgi:hypothetical protein
MEISEIINNKKIEITEKSEEQIKNCGLLEQNLKKALTDPRFILNGLFSCDDYNKYMYMINDAIIKDHIIPALKTLEVFNSDNIFLRYSPYCIISIYNGDCHLFDINMNSLEFYQIKHNISRNENKAIDHIIASVKQLEKFRTEKNFRNFIELWKIDCCNQNKFQKIGWFFITIPALLNEKKVQKVLSEAKRWSFIYCFSTALQGC